MLKKLHSSILNTPSSLGENIKLPFQEIKSNFLENIEPKNEKIKIIKSNSYGLPSWHKSPRIEMWSPISHAELKNLRYDPGKHVIPKSFTESISHKIVKTLRFIADIYFQKNYVRRAVVLETVAAIPGMVGGLFRHLYSLRNLKDNGKVIEKLINEAENERQHLLTFLQIMRPNLFDRFVIKFTQMWFFNFYLLFYFFLPKTAHRFVGYLEEEAIRSYDCFEEEILNGNIENVNAPKIAIKYWNLPKDSKLIDVVRAVRADEADHRDSNHQLANDTDFSLGNNPFK